MAIDQTVKVTDVISVTGEQRALFGISLFLTKDTQLPAGAGRLAVLASMADAAALFTDGSAPYKAAEVHFSQVPYPKNLIVGRWITADVAATVRGGTASALATIQAISDGSLVINGETVTGLNFGSAGSYADIATTLQAALRATTETDLTLCTVAYQATSTSFLVTSGVTGATSALTVATTAASGTDVSGLLGLSEAAGAVATPGAVAETLAEAMDAILALNPNPYFLILDPALNDTADVDSANAYVQSKDMQFRMECNATAALTTGESGSKLATLAVAQPGRTFGCWTPAASQYLAVSAAARLGSINFNSPNSMITLNLQSMPGIVPAELTTTQQTELKRKRTSYYIKQGTRNAYLNNGGFATNVWDDVRIWLDWFKNAVRTEVYNLLASGRVYQTAAGQVSIQRAIELVCEQGVSNGGIAPGQVSEALRADIAAATGNEDFDGYLPRGYLVYADPVTSLSQSDRDARKMPPVRIWLKGSGAVHFVDIEIVFEN